jgi:methyltransferase-like protein
MVGRRIAEEYILVPIVGRGADVEAIYTLNGVATFIWERLDGTQSGAAIVDAIVEQFEADRAAAARDYVQFLAKLVSISAVHRRYAS